MGSQYINRSINSCDRLSTFINYELLPQLFVAVLYSEFMDCLAMMKFLKTDTNLIAIQTK